MQEHTQGKRLQEQRGKKRLIFNEDSANFTAKMTFELKQEERRFCRTLWAEDRVAKGWFPGVTVTNYSKLGGLTTEIYFPVLQKTRSSKSRCWDG